MTDLTAAVARLTDALPEQWRELADIINRLAAERDTLRARVAELEAAQARAIAEAVEVALDPRVSSDAQALIDRGAAQASTGARVVPMLTDKAVHDLVTDWFDDEAEHTRWGTCLARDVEARVRELCGIGQAGAEGGETNG